MKKYDDVKAEKVSSGREMLPAGGYVCQILSARVESGEWGDTLVIAHDVCEGEFSGIFKRDYDNNTREDKKWRGTYRLRLRQLHLGCRAEQQRIRLELGREDPQGQENRSDLPK